MKKIKNPFIPREDYRCFGCSPDNPIGLHLEFFDEGEYIVSHWTPRQEYQGYANVLHGGIQATLMDEIASWTIYVKAGTGGVTSRMETRYKKPVYTDQGPLELRAKIKNTNRRIITVEVQLLNHQGQLCSVSEVDYFTMPEEDAKKKLFYPGKDAFL